MAALCGCCYHQANLWQYLPQVALKAHATILSSAARTTLTQTFVNPSDRILEEVSYTFPLYDGVSVVGFQCHVGARLLSSKIKTKEDANAAYEKAVTNHQTAAIMEHTSHENDVFVIRLGNVPAKETITVEITFIGELKQDSQTDGVRYTLPNAIAPRYSNTMSYPQHTLVPSLSANIQGISITVDVQMEKTSIIRELQSPSHSIKVSLGRTSSTPENVSTFEPSQASATLHLTKENHALLERDFVLVAKADGLDNPRALLESHPTIPGQRALMATLVPKFNLPPAKPEVVFVIDQSGSMEDKVTTVRSALKIFLKSLPVGICFNLCSFGCDHTFLWPTSRVYDASSLQDALSYVDTVDSNMGGTEIQSAVEAVVANRLENTDLEVLILTDGEIWDQPSMFGFVRKTAASHTARFFSLGIGDAASHSLIEGIARVGNGISQTVLEYEELDRKVVRMLKGALTPHIYDYKLEVEYDATAHDDFEVVSNSDHLMVDSETEAGDDTEQAQQQTPQQPISLFDENFKESEAELGIPQPADGGNLPSISAPKTLQAPYKIPPLYPFIRTTVYLLVDPRSSDRAPQSLTFSATSKQGPLKLRIPLTDVGTGETIHQLASRKAVIELEEQHGWLEDAKDASGNPFHQLHPDTKQRLAVRECQTLGIKYHVTGKYCSFVALDENSDESATSEQRSKPKAFEARTVPHIPIGSYAIRYSSQPYIPPHKTASKRKSRVAMRSVPSAGVHGGTRGVSHVGGRGGSRGGGQANYSPAQTQSYISEAASPAMQLRELSAAVPGASVYSASGQTDIHALIGMQTYQGYWELTEELCHLLGCDMHQVSASFRRIVKISNIDLLQSRVLATYLVMGVLENKHAESRSVWDLVYEKAEEWVDETLPTMGTTGVAIAAHRFEIMFLA